MGYIARKTLKLRHKIVKLIAPKFYADYFKYKNAISDIPRPMILFLKSHVKNELVGAEIGVAQGDNALSILETLPIKKLYLIDPYLPYLENEQVRKAGSCDTVKARLSIFPQTIFIQKTSEEAVKEIDEPLDFVYIDGNHSYEFVKRDIELYSKLVKQGGLLGGHDYTKFYGDVMRAVNEFVKEHDIIDFYVSYPDWWVLKKVKL